ncbi:PhzF family phenazine biosynthesis protein [Sulfitobacter mediterraneus]|uniref:PhzF family phenazine biosynthesis protein n=1 Tax=Sulfitobacter mediterraneus TaxID=83219 RepID=UPI001931E551|nr:PhzF family phenazine biosynthesis protein [Sulfitobacter mediterraneus]MBM1633264.1 PhzF family phenazine biosynthesis protein [Sulfitobacter mediterraneus]MBM1640602.1 PhzF family phenazine biosynthesis protein [Sulfitobacter mediterraneus]MBM1645129.1 PhzF family phenazine biosynthesis protein [Sulfitobacter mediterraneus]MBM1648722.1 PhzF family phenazine biosynthesis protein [Sulfitobacter mediterraneus]MBM1652743.1 PhzF family phenazine biosynthesis protein [Sulfitobacter mediterraneu
MPRTQDDYNFVHCDVFASQPYAGNSLAVFTDCAGLSAQQMLRMTQEMRHFESIFLSQDQDRITARVFDLLEELPFAGHPLIGAACTLHRASGDTAPQTWAITLNGGRMVTIRTALENGIYTGTLDQGAPDFIAVLPMGAKPGFADAFHLAETQMADLPLEVISTGLKYLVIPVSGGLDQARITVDDLDQQLAAVGAEFAYLFDVDTFEGRHWNNDGVIEDVATGSAAGVVGAYALKHGLINAGDPVTLRQGHFMGRPSQLQVTAYGTPDSITNISVAGHVAFVGEGKVCAP